MRRPEGRVRGPLQEAGWEGCGRVGTRTKMHFMARVKALDVGPEVLTGQPWGHRSEPR